MKNKSWIFSKIPVLQKLSDLVTRNHHYSAEDAGQDGDGNNEGSPTDTLCELDVMSGAGSPDRDAPTTLTGFGGRQPEQPSSARKERRGSLSSVASSVDGGGHSRHTRGSSRGNTGDDLSEQLSQDGVEEFKDSEASEDVQEAVAHFFPDVTVMFIYVQNLNSLSSKADPLELVTYLNRL